MNCKNCKKEIENPDKAIVIKSSKGDLYFCSEECLEAYSEMEIEMAKAETEMQMMAEEEEQQYEEHEHEGR